MSATPGWDVEIKSTPLGRASRWVIITHIPIWHTSGMRRLMGDACPGVALISFAYAPATCCNPLRDKEDKGVFVMKREARAMHLPRRWNKSIRRSTLLALSDAVGMKGGSSEI